MPNGRPYDNPVTDTVFHGLHPFPQEIERLVIQVHARNPGVFNDLEWAPFDWEKGKNLFDAEKVLEGLLEHHGDPGACQRLVREYLVATKGESPDA